MKEIRIKGLIYFSPFKDEQGTTMEERERNEERVWRVKTLSLD